MRSTVRVQETFTAPPQGWGSQSEACCLVWRGNRYTRRCFLFEEKKAGGSWRCFVTETACRQAHISTFVVRGSAEYVEVHVWSRMGPMCACIWVENIHWQVLCECVCVSMPLCVDKHFECLVVAVSRMVRATENDFSRACESFQG